MVQFNSVGDVPENAVTGKNPEGEFDEVGCSLGYCEDCEYAPFVVLEDQSVQKSGP